MNVFTSFIEASQCFLKFDISVGSESWAFAVVFPGHTGRLRPRRLLATILFLCCIGGTLHAQDVSGTIVGTVTGRYRSNGPECPTLLGHQ